MSIIDQKEYLKRYLSSDGDPKHGKKKKKRIKKPALGTTRVTIIDDDIDLSNVKTLEEAASLLESHEDAPQVVGVIDERPMHLRINDYKTNQWKPLGTEDEPIEVTSPLSQSDTSFSLKPKDSKSSSQSMRDSSPPRRKRRSPSPVSTPRRSPSADNSPPRRHSRKYDDDSSPPRRPTKKYDDDSSPPRRSTKKYDDDSSPPRKSSRREDMSPPRKRRSSDNSSPRRSTKTSRDSSPLSKHRSRKEDHSPPRKSSRWSEPSPPIKPSFPDDSKRKMLPGNSKGKYLIPAKRPEKMTKTLDGRKAGLQDAHQLTAENEIFKKREDEMFASMSSDVSGRNAMPVMRDRKTGKIRDLEQEEKDRAEKAKIEAENKEKYTRWGRGLKQVEDRENQIADELREMNKPLARYADDEDLEEYLKGQMREGDPMLEFMRNKNVLEPGTVVKQTTTTFNYLPNRFGIPPGAKWDGVNRSNGYEEKWIKAQNAKLTQQEETYKWSTEDL